MTAVTALAMSLHWLCHACKTASRDSEIQAHVPYSAALAITRAIDAARGVHCCKCGRAKP